MAKYLNTDLIFKDRTDAGNQLANKLSSYKSRDSIVIGLPRGGVAVAKPIAKVLDSKLDIIVSKKIGAPNNPELAIGAVTSYGDYVISSYVDYELGEQKWDYLQKQIVYLVKDCQEREKKYLSSRDAPVECLSYKNRNIILVDDGTATGMTALAAIKSIKKQNPNFIILAIPVISSQAYEEIVNLVDKVETLKIPREFGAVGVHYENFEPVTDDEIKKMLV
ncbi:MAG: phosphoribosyltransferase [Candidatus Melainabacteria bacterium]|nr:phosphoribosyltransferase [Candidatus Melainabacteria bacterium]